MLATIWLLGLILGQPQGTPRPAPVAVRGDLVLTPKLARGQELVYRGTFTEKAADTRVQFTRVYRFESRFFVMDVPAQGVDLAVLTSLQDRNAKSRESASARLEKIRLDLAGKVTASPGMSLTVPLEGAPSLEVGSFLDLPRPRLAVGQTWTVRESDRPPSVWKVAGNKSIGPINCLELVGVQQSDDWDRPRADRGAWKRTDTVYLSPRTGLAARVERTIEHREPARREVARTSILRYDLESDFTYPARLADDRRLEINLALSLREQARPMLAEPGKNTRQLAALQKRIALHIDQQPPTPFRDALFALRKQVEAAARGEIAPVVHHESARATANATATVGDPAPDFVATEMTGSGSARLAKWKGKSILLVFYHPSSFTAGDLLRFAQETHESLGKYVQVVGMSVSDDSDSVLKQRAALKLGFPILFGGGLRISYGVESTPRIVLIDSVGVIRAAYNGWGRETAAEATAEIRQWLPR